MNIELRNQLAARLFIAAMSEEYTDEGANKSLVETITEDSLWAATIFANRVETYDADQKSEKHNPEERRANGDRRQGERRGSCGCSTEEDEAFEQLERALKEQFLQATLHSIFNKAQ